MADTDNPRIWLGATVYVADVGATVPTDTSSAWDAAWSDVGLVSEDGMAEAREQESNDYWAWGGILIRREHTKHLSTFGLTILEDTDLIFELTNPGSTSVTAAGTTTRTYRKPTRVEKAFGFELVDGGITSRLVLPRCSLEVGGKTFSDSDLAGRELTITPQHDEQGVWGYEITDDPQAASS